MRLPNLLSSGTGCRSRLSYGYHLQSRSGKRPREVLEGVQLGTRPDHDKMGDLREAGITRNYISYFSERPEIADDRINAVSNGHHAGDVHIFVRNERQNILRIK